MPGLGIFDKYIMYGKEWYNYTNSELLKLLQETEEAALEEDESFCREIREVLVKRWADKARNMHPVKYVWRKRI